MNKERKKERRKGGERERMQMDIRKEKKGRAID